MWQRPKSIMDPYDLQELLNELQALSQQAGKAWHHEQAYNRGLRSINRYLGGLNHGH